MRNLTKYVAPIMAATAMSGCVIESDSRTGGTYSHPDATVDAYDAADVMRHDIQDRVDAAIGNDGSSHIDGGNFPDVRDVNSPDIPNPDVCLTVLPSKATQIVQDFTSRITGSLIKNEDFPLPIFAFDEIYTELTSYGVKIEGHDQGNLIRGGISRSDQQTIVAVTDFNDSLRQFSNIQFGETMFSGNTPIAMRTYGSNGPIVQGSNAIDYELLAKVQTDGTCAVRIEDTRTNPDTVETHYICRPACENLLQGVGNTSVHVINQLN